MAPLGILILSLTGPSSTMGAVFSTSPFVSFGCLSQTPRSYCFLISFPMPRNWVSLRPFVTRSAAVPARSKNSVDSLPFSASNQPFR